MIHPMDEVNMWPTSGRQGQRQPTYHRQPRRPKKARKMVANEPKKGANDPHKTRSQISLKCNNCGTMCHNKRSCKQTFRNTSEPSNEAPNATNNE